MIQHTLMCSRQQFLREILDILVNFPDCCFLEWHWMKWVSSPVLTFSCFKAVLQLQIRIYKLELVWYHMITAIVDNLRNFYHPGQAKTGNVHPGQTPKFRKKYTLSHMNCVSMTLQGRRISTSALLKSIFTF